MLDLGHHWHQKWDLGPHWHQKQDLGHQWHQKRDQVAQIAHLQISQLPNNQARYKFTY